MSNQKNWSNINYINLPHTFYGRGIVSPSDRFYVSVRSVNSRPNALNWGVLDLYTDQYIDGFRFRKEAVAYVESYERVTF
jgi:hypothetical protein